MYNYKIINQIKFIKLLISHKAILLFAIAYIFFDIALFFLNINYTSSIPLYIVSVLICNISVLPILIWLFFRTHDHFPLIQIYFLSILIFYGLAGCYWPAWYIGQPDVSEIDYLIAQLLVILSISITLFAYSVVGFDSNLFKIFASYAILRLPRNLLLFAIVPTIVIIQIVSLNSYFDDNFKYGSFINSLLINSESFFILYILSYFFFDFLRRKNTQINSFTSIAIVILCGSLVVIKSITNGVMFSIISLSVLFLFTVIVNNRKKLIIILIPFLLIGGFLDQGKNNFRTLTWYNNQISSTANKLILLIELSIKSSEENNFSDKVRKVYTRYDFLHLLAAVNRIVPAHLSYLHPSTYNILITKFVPRFLWENKPKEQNGSLWGKKIGWIADSDNRTSLNMPWIVEMWVNGGLKVLLLFSTIIGVYFKLLQSILLQNITQSPEHYATSMALILPVILFQESNFSISFGLLVMNLIFVLIINIGIKTLSRI